MIRAASYLDIPVLLMLLSEMHEEGPYEVDALNWPKVVRKVVDAVDKGVVFVWEEDGNIFGSIGGELGPNWFSDKVAFGDLWFYVRESKRNSKAGIELLRAVRDWGRKEEIPVTVAHVFAGDVERKDKLYERLEFVKIGSIFSEGF